MHGGGRDAEGDGVSLPEDSGGSGDGRDIAQHTGADAVFLVGRGVFGEGGVVVGAFVVVVARLLGHVGRSEGFEFGYCEALEVVRGRGFVAGWRRGFGGGHGLW